MKIDHVQENARTCVGEENQIICGGDCRFTRSEVEFIGKRNMLYLEKNIHLQNSKIIFHADHAMVFLSSSRHAYKLNLSIYHTSAFFMGRNNYMNGTLHAILSEQKHLFIGNDGAFSFGIFIRNADPHLIYSTAQMKRINHSRSVFLGDHIWVGQNAVLLKGTEIHSGSIIGANSVIANKVVPSNTSYAGNPAKLIKSQIFWTGACVHQWREEETKKMETYVDRQFLYAPDAHSISFQDVDASLDQCKTAEEKLTYLKQLAINSNKDRFAR